MCRICLATCLGLTLSWVIGCAQAPNGTAPAAKVQGTVRIDGKPISAGEIHFATAGYPPMVMSITDGSYSGEAPIGKNLVEVFIFVEGPPSEKYGGTRPKINTTPEKYWGPNTILDATVSADGANEFKFEISSK